MLSIAAGCVKSTANSGYSQTDQRASSRRQAVPTGSRAIHNSQFRLVSFLPFAPIFRSQGAGLETLASGVVVRPAYVNGSRLPHFQPRVKG